MPSLTGNRAVRLADGRNAHLYAYGGHDWPVVDDAENGLLVIELFRDGDLAPDEKAGLLLHMLFCDPATAIAKAGDGLGALLSALVWDAFGLDIDGGREHSAPVFDWDEDADRIRATLLMAYGVRWDEVKDKLSYRELCAYLGLAPHETPFGQAVYYRMADEPKATKHNQAEVDHFRKAREHYALRARPDDAAAKSDAAFAALARRANG
jgi:hypothetical protein